MEEEVLKKTISVYKKYIILGVLLGLSLGVSFIMSIFYVLSTIFWQIK